MATLCVSGAAIFKAGSSVSTDITEAQYDYALTEAESYVCNATHFNWVTDYAGYTTELKLILQNAVANKAAKYLINFDTTGYTQRQAEFMMDILESELDDDIKLLKDKATRDFIIEA